MYKLGLTIDDGHLVLKQHSKRINDLSSIWSYILLF